MLHKQSGELGEGPVCASSLSSTTNTMAGSLDSDLYDGEHLVASIYIASCL